ncbi:MAG: diguanylate cyclase domain-containing protein [Lachnospirales bacterium]
MLSFYSMTVFFMIFAGLIMIAIISADNLIPYDSKKAFRNVFVIINISILLEWAITVNYNNENLGDFTSFLLFKVAAALLYILAPISIYLIGRAFTNTRLIKNILWFIIGNVGFQIFILLHKDFFISNQTYLAPNNLYWIYNIILVICLISAIISVYKMSMKYQSRNQYILVFIVVILFFGNFFQALNDEYLVYLFSGSLATMFAYAYFVSIVNKIDVLTHILNRRCFESKIRKPKKDLIILFFDVNKFKEVNDTFGHGYGDYVLIKLCSIIMDIYGKNGFCYRIGGDEFCVILDKRLYEIDKLNEKFVLKVIEEQSKEKNLPDLSFGYSKFVYGKDDIKEVIKAADAMMYKVKAENKFFERQ